MTDTESIATQAAPYCYRHPSRETSIACTRCGRPICPDCMIPASVGFQCPECVRDGHRTQGVARTALGGRLSPRQSGVTLTLIAINVVCFIAEQASNAFELRFSLVPISGFASPYAGVAHGEYYRLVSAMFLHANITHILFNMWALYVVGQPLEAMLGRARFIVLYFLSGLAGSAVAYLFAQPQSQTLGASGAIFGLFGALFVLGRKMRFDIRPIGITIAINLAITFAVPGISWEGHLGGLAGGAALAAAWAYAPRQRRAGVQVVSSLALAGLIVLAVIMRTHALLT